MCRTSSVGLLQFIFAFSRALNASIGRLTLIGVIGGSLLGPVGARGQSVSGNVEPRDHQHDNRSHFRNELPKTVQANHPAILPVVAAIRAISQDPREQLMMVNDVTHLLVDYDEDERVYGKVEFHATLDEMIARRREAGWVYLRDDCDGRAIFAAHLLAGLGIPWHLQASYWKRHAWITATVGGVDYDLLDLRHDAPECRELSYQLVGHWFTRASRFPPYFNWRQAWVERTHSDLQIGVRLGLLELDSTPGRLHERFAVDWTRQYPEGTVSPFDPRTLTASYAVFPYGEPLHFGALAALDAPKSDSGDRGPSRAPLAQSSAPADGREVGLGP